MPRYKYCFVPMCRNTSVTAPEKLFVTVPRIPDVTKKWFRAARRDTSKPLSDKTLSFCCEDHFDLETDFENAMFVKLMRDSSEKIRIQLKKGVVPSKFACQTSRMLTDVGAFPVPERSHSCEKGDISGSPIEEFPFAESSTPSLSDSPSEHLLKVLLNLEKINDKDFNFCMLLYHEMKLLPSEKNKEDLIKYIQRALVLAYDEQHS